MWERGIGIMRMKIVWLGEIFKGCLFFFRFFGFFKLGFKDIYVRCDGIVCFFG